MPSLVERLSLAESYLLAGEQSRMVWAAIEEIREVSKQLVQQEIKPHTPASHANEFWSADCKEPICLQARHDYGPCRCGQSYLHIESAHNLSTSY